MVILPTVPRSGNTLFRDLFHEATGIQTHSVFEEGGTIALHGYVHVSHNVLSGFRVDWCRLVVKVHFPFIGGPGEFPFFSAIRTIRDPLSNYGAWVDYCETKEWCEEIPGLPKGFEKFVEKWVRFHEFWDSVRVPTHIIRFEQLTTEPCAVMKQAIENQPGFEQFSSRVDSLCDKFHQMVVRSNRARLDGDCSNGSFPVARSATVSVQQYKAVIKDPRVSALIKKHKLPVYCKINE